MPIGGVRSLQVGVLSDFGRGARRPFLKDIETGFRG
jgi:hypothetical protein